MNLVISKTAKELGAAAAEKAAIILKETIKENGEARLLVSTGASQFETLDALKDLDVDWSKVTMFHLDEYVGLPESHIASFRKYLKERFVNFIPLKEAFYVNGEGDVKENIEKLTIEVRKAPMDLGLIGIGENAHIAFNDPPADFDTREAFKVVTLDEKCKAQQVGEGWFANNEEVPKEAISMTVYQIMQCKKIISCVPHEVKAKAIMDTLGNDLTNMIPATMLKEHKEWSLFLDEGSAKLIQK